MEVISDVAGREDPRDAGLQAPVDENAVVDGEPRRRREVRAGRRTDAHDHAGAVDRMPRPGADALDRAFALERRDAVAEDHVDAAVEMDVAVDRSNLRPEHPLQGDLARLDDGDLDAA